MVDITDCRTVCDTSTVLHTHSSSHQFRHTELPKWAVLCHIMACDASGQFWGRELVNGQETWDAARQVTLLRMPYFASRPRPRLV